MSSVPPRAPLKASRTAATRSGRLLDQARFVQMRMLRIIIFPKRVAQIQRGSRIEGYEKFSVSSRLRDTRRGRELNSRPSSYAGASSQRHSNFRYLNERVRIARYEQDRTCVAMPPALATTDSVTPIVYVLFAPHRAAERLLPRSAIFLFSSKIDAVQRINQEGGSCCVQEHGRSLRGSRWWPWRLVVKSAATYAPALARDDSRSERLGISVIQKWHPNSPAGLAPVDLASSK